ncbi:MAG: histidine kinase [Fibrobacteres bacterium]|nr:histidine kinase [Fibrobacterota bacterium]
MLVRKLSVAFMVSVALLTVTTLLSGSYVAINYLNDRDRELAALRAELVQAANQTAISMALPLWNFDRPQMEKVAESRLQDSSITRMVIQAADGAVLIDMKKGAEAESGKPPPGSETLVEKESVTFADQRLATVTVYATTRLVVARLKEHLLWTIVYILVLDAALVLSLYFLLRLWVFRPLREVEAYAATVSAGGRAGEVRRFRGELESLRSSVEQMIGQVQGRYNQLQMEIVEREKAEEELRRVSERLSLATRAGGVGVWDWDIRLNVITWDDQMFVLNGVDKGRFSGTYEAWQAGLLVEDAKRADEEVQMALRGEKDFDTEFRILRPDGSIRNIRALASVKRDGSGKPLRMIGTNWDITEARLAQERARAQQQQLVQSDKINSLGMMVSGVAHEINNPNNLIMLNADVIETFYRFLSPVLRKHAAANPEWTVANIPYDKMEGKMETLISGIAGGARRIKRIVDNLKDFARLDAGELIESVPLEKVVEASVGIVENLIKKSTNHFSILHKEAEPLPRIKGNFQKLEQVIINLITNSCQALEDRSRAIRISTWFEPDGNRVVLCVEDEGKGVPKELLGKVADPFFTTKRDTGGTGLGLSVSYGIIQEHKGEIRFDSEPSRGTTIEIRIPAQAGGSRKTG